jgi:hypothetical protein
MPRRHPERFTWNQAPRPKPLSLWSLAPDEPGFYELGFVRGGSFEAKYGGRASDLTLRRRLRQHWEGSHNPEVRRHRSALWFRCKALPDASYARAVEAHYLAAFDYDWNARQEWAEHWALERRR